MSGAVSADTQVFLAASRLMVALANPPTCPLRWPGDHGEAEALEQFALSVDELTNGVVALFMALRQVAANNGAEISVTDTDRDAMKGSLFDDFHACNKQAQFIRDNIGATIAECRRDERED